MFGRYNTRYLRSRKSTPAQSGITVIETSFFHHSLATSKRTAGVWLHENCGSRQSAEHDLGRIVIREDDISGMRSKMLKVKLDISEEGLLFRDPVLEMDCGTQMSITWESSSLSFSSNNGMDNVRAQLAKEMKSLHTT
jgi:hypothetical protein